MMTAREAARILGGSVAGARTVTCPGPGHSPRDRSLSVTFDARGDFVVHSHAGDDWQACRDHVRDLLGLGRWQPRGDRPAAPSRTMPLAADDGAERQMALRIWNETRDARGTLAETYLASRGLALDDRAAESVRFHPSLRLRPSLRFHPSLRLRPSLRFHPSLRFGAKTAPGMVTLYRDLRTDEPKAIQRTFLSPEGRKLERWMLGPVQNAAVKLDPDEEVSERLVVGEGVESCLAAREYRYRPCWALGSAGAIARLPVLPGVERLAILGEKGDGGANERATRDCARRWKATGAEVKWIEPLMGDDANDVLLAGMAG